jgi:hypothetical protein
VKIGDLAFENLLHILRHSYSTGRRQSGEASLDFWTKVYRNSHQRYLAPKYMRDRRIKCMSI